MKMRDLVNTAQLPLFERAATPDVGAAIPGLFVGHTDEPCAPCETQGTNDSFLSSLGLHREDRVAVPMDSCGAGYEKCTRCGAWFDPTDENLDYHDHAPLLSSFERYDGHKIATYLPTFIERERLAHEYGAAVWARSPRWLERSLRKVFVA